MPLGSKVAVVGGGLVGIELAEFLSERGREVAVYEEGATFAAQMSPPRRWRALHHLRTRGVDLHAEVRVEAIGDEGVTFVDKDGARHSAAADSVILAAGTAPDQRLTEAIAELAAEVRAIGDCDGIGYIQGAILDGARAARQI
jgi:pyruvate/2-oxoglutarate dehydrogenase complex dihydrolipoamide dehydrogenase (E3) component